MSGASFFPDLLHYDVAAADKRLHAAQAASCNALLRAHLRSGQHLLVHARAVEVGRRIGLHPREVRPAAGDPTIRSARA